MPDNISLLNFRYSPVKISLIIAALSTASQPARAIEFATGILNMDDNDKVNLKNSNELVISLLVSIDYQFH